jgi:hypothetical protein
MLTSRFWIVDVHYSGEKYNFSYNFEFGSMGAEMATLPANTHEFTLQYHFDTDQLRSVRQSGYR